MHIRIMDTLFVPLAMIPCVVAIFWCFEIGGGKNDSIGFGVVGIACLFLAGALIIGAWRSNAGEDRLYFAIAAVALIATSVVLYKIWKRKR